MNECKCRQPMRIELRTIIYAENIEILYVPIKICEECKSYHLLKSIKPMLVHYMQTIDVGSNKIKVSFTEMNEVAEVFYEVFSQNEEDMSEVLAQTLKEIIDERINALLDLFHYAEGMQDIEWIEDLRQRLSQYSSVLAELDDVKLYSHEK
ncbi:hypothetical protein [Paenibacillus crassostreae]|uniref:Uncharacterized protein n=1 Tax=Paenibacillus crassostreae TaxID=1763538 RepID=A0A162KRR4_9BACL|nr:hypothetical protein [Paenibacillus crassostreae]AOZ91563.1 hypothetical protein LPB68_04600 [Paenibacillus crassostreae]OAB72863.1 hypothetical protein PNBC_15650 [Paenibacillus crassostreae]